jgi:hypothetical protein
MYQRSEADIMSGTSIFRAVRQSRVSPIRLAIFLEVGVRPECFFATEEVVARIDVLDSLIRRGSHGEAIDFFATEKVVARIDVLGNLIRRRWLGGAIDFVADCRASPRHAIMSEVRITSVCVKLFNDNW